MDLAQIARLCPLGSGLSRRVRRRPLSGPATTECHGINGAYHLALHDLVLVDRDVTDSRDILDVDVLQ